MKKAIMASIIALSAIGLVGCDRVEPGNVGIKVNKLGDDKGVGEVVGVGRYWTGWNTEVYIFPTFKQMKTYEDAFNFQMSDGTPSATTSGSRTRLIRPKLQPFSRPTVKAWTTSPTPTCGRKLLTPLIVSQVG